MREKKEIKQEDIKKMPKIILLGKNSIEIIGVCHVLEAFGFDIRALGPIELLPEFLEKLQEKITVNWIFIWKEQYLVDKVAEIVKSNSVNVAVCGFFYQEDFDKNKNLFTIAGFEAFVNNFPSLLMMGNLSSVVTGKVFNYGSLYLLPGD